jgi:DNA-directed RNA polymerase specialized sigma24 family protein
MEGQDRETAGKRKTKNSTSLAEGEKILAKAKKESERQAKKEQKLKEKEEKNLEYALSLSSLEARMNGTLLINEQEAFRKEEAAHLLNVHASYLCSHLSRKRRS